MLIQNKQLKINNNLKIQKMKKLVSIMAVAAFMLSMNVNAQEPKKKTKKETAKTEKSCSTAEKKSCSTEAKSGGCCSSKKAAEKKAE